VSDAELEDIVRFGFRPGAGTMETKLFTTSAENATFFAQHILFPLDQKPLTIVEVEIQDSLVSRLFYFTTDGKTTIAVERYLLAEFNAAAGIRLLHFTPLPIP
jgi:hypothetical protein